MVAIQYETVCSEYIETSKERLKHFVDILTKASLIEKWTDMEKWSVRQGLESSFFKAYTAIDKNVSYHELIAKNDPLSYVQLHAPARFNPDTVIIDLRPDVTTFSGSDEERAKEYIYLLQDAGLSTEMTDALLEGFSISNRVDEKLTEQHKLTNPDENVLQFFRQKYMKYNGLYSTAVQWQHLWDCGIHSLNLHRGIVCELPIKQEFDWTSYFRDDYWGSVAESGDIVPLLEHDLPEHWVVSPYLITALSRSILYYRNQEMKNLILWRMAKQLTRHIDSSTKSTLRLDSSYYDCPSTFSSTIRRLKARYEWYEKFSERTREQIYEMWADVNFQMKYRRYSRLLEAGKDEDYEQMKSLILLDYMNTEHYPQFPYASKYVEPVVSVEDNKSNPSRLDFALRFQKVERSLLLRTARLEYLSDDEHYLIDSLGLLQFPRFMADRPASLNYGALGSAIGYNLVTRFNEPWMHNLNFFNNYKRCVEKNSPDFIANNLTKFYELASVTFGLEAAWYAYEQHAALYGETNEKLPQAIYNKMPEYDNEQLFFVSFGNSLCGGNYSEELINVAVNSLPQFSEAFKCQNNHDHKWADCQFD